MARIIIFIGICAALGYGVYAFKDTAVRALQQGSVRVANSIEYGTKDNSGTTASITIGWVGDMVPTLSDEYNLHVFDNVKEYTQKPTLLIGNLEGTFAQENRVSKCAYILSQCHAFRGAPSFADALIDAGFDVISLINNHSYDYGDEGLSDTEKILQEKKIPYISQKKPILETVINNKRIGILGVSSTPPQSSITDYNFIKNTITSLKQRNDIVILIFHGGSEGSNKTEVINDYEYVGTENRGNLSKMAYTAIDAGADIILGSGPHVLRKTEYYRGKPIIYSAGNFIGGNGKLLTKGILGISGIFTVSLSNNNTFPITINSVILSKEGIPTFDIEERGRLLIETLSGQ